MNLVLSGVTIERDNAVLLGPLDADLNVKGITAVLGHNGAGKSLFLRTIHGLIRASSGQVLWDGQLAERTRPQRGFVFQSPKVMRRSVADNVMFPLIARGVARQSATSEVQTMLRRMKLAEFADQPAATLSGGEQQRMALARALMTRPGVLIFDEPTASMDEPSRQNFENLILETVNDGASVIMSTHDHSQAKRLANRILTFKDGQIVG